MKGQDYSRRPNAPYRTTDKCLNSFFKLSSFLTEQINCLLRQSCQLNCSEPVYLGHKQSPTTSIELCVINILSNKVVFYLYSGLKSFDLGDMFYSYCHTDMYVIYRGVPNVWYIYCNFWMDWNWITQNRR